MQYYTYAYLREDRTPYYIGKGKDNRAHRRRYKGIKPPKDKNRILILKNNLNEEQAFKHEKYMISVFGRKDLGTGILHNRTDAAETKDKVVKWVLPVDDNGVLIFPEDLLEAANLKEGDKIEWIPQDDQSCILRKV